MNDLTVQRLGAKISNDEQKPNFFPVRDIIINPGSETHLKFKIECPNIKTGAK